jgi:riboflavin synthase
MARAGPVPQRRVSRAFPEPGHGWLLRRRAQVFTGIVEERGEVVALESGTDSATLTIRGPLVAGGAGRGDSIAVNGVCLTVTGRSGGTFSAHVMGETLARTSLGGLGPGDPVNLERPVRADGRLDGHIVQGHVDGTGTVTGRREAPGWNVVRIAIPAALSRYLAEKGSVAVDGVSLTVSAAWSDEAAGGNPWFEVSLIPETLQRTTLGTCRPGDTVNIEADVIAKYVERLLGAGSPS